MRRRHRRENKALKLLIQAAAGVAACISSVDIILCIYLVERAAHIPADRRRGSGADAAGAGRAAGY